MKIYVNWAKSPFLWAYGYSTDVNAQQHKIQFLISIIIDVGGSWEPTRN